jgi:hypothetical protein
MEYAGGVPVESDDATGIVDPKRSVAGCTGNVDRGEVLSDRIKNITVSYPRDLVASHDIS